jgi:hypothetical protein
MLILLLGSSYQGDVENIADVSEVHAAIHLSFPLKIEVADTSETSATVPICVWCKDPRA